MYTLLAGCASAELKQLSVDTNYNANYQVLQLDVVLSNDSDSTSLINKLTKELAAISKKLQNQNFLNKAPQDVVEQVKAKHERLQEKQQKLESHLDRIKDLET